jgi:anti-sigma B factor antagonist
LPVAGGQARSASSSLRIMPRTDAGPQPRPQVPDRTGTADLHVAVCSGPTVVVEICGEIDIQSAPELRDELLRVIRRYGPWLALDLAGVRFMDCAGLNVLLATRRRARLEEGWVRVIRASPQVLRMISLLGLEKVFALGGQHVG